MLAGAIAGMAEHTVMYPVDTIKTRMQALAHPGMQVSLITLLSSSLTSTTLKQQLHGSTIRRAMRVIVKHEGVAGLYRGVGAVLAGTGCVTMFAPIASYKTHPLQASTCPLLWCLRGSQGGHGRQQRRPPATRNRGGGGSSNSRE